MSCNSRVIVARTLSGTPSGKPPRRTLPGERFQMRLWRRPGRHRLVRIFIDEFIERKPASLHDGNRARHRLLVSTKETSHFLGPLEVSLGVCLQPVPGLVDGRMLAHAGQHVLQWPPVRRVIEYGVGRNERRAACGGHRRERSDPRPVIATVGMRRRQIKCGGSQCRLNAPQLCSEILLQCLRRHDDENIAFRKNGYVVKPQDALPFLRPALPERKKP